MNSSCSCLSVLLCFLHLLLFVAFVKIRSAVCSWTPETNLLNEIFPSEWRRRSPAPHLAVFDQPPVMDAECFIYLRKVELLTTDESFCSVNSPRGRKGRRIPRSHEIFIHSSDCMLSKRTGRKRNAALQEIFGKSLINGQIQIGGGKNHTFLLERTKKLTEAGEEKQKLFTCCIRGREKEIVYGIKKCRRTDGRGWVAERKKRKKSRLSPAGFHTSEEAKRRESFSTVTDPTERQRKYNSVTFSV